MRAKIMGEREMGHQMRLYKQVERLLKKGKLDEIAELILSEEYLHEMDKKQRQTVAQLIASNKKHFRPLVTRLIEEERISVDADFGDLFSPMSLLRACIFMGEEDFAIELIERGARLDGVQEGGMTLVHDAAQQGQTRVLEAMYRYGAELDAQTADDHEGNASAIQMACMDGMEDVVSCLLEFGCELEQENHRGESLLQIAVKNRHEGLVRLLLEQGADVNVSKITGRTPLHEAVNRRQPALTRMLLKGGADPDLVDEYGWSALHLASAKGDAESVVLLCDAGADRDLRTEDVCRLRGVEVESGATCLDVAEAYNQMKVKDVLMSFE